MNHSPRTITLLGPQRRPTVDKVIKSLEGDARIATVTAGWQEREPDDKELSELLGGRDVNLALHGRWLDVLQQDAEFAAAEKEHQTVLDELQRLYLVQLDHALRAAYSVVQRKSSHPRVAEAAAEDSLAMVRLVDEKHLGRVTSSRRDFDDAWRPAEREVIARHCEEIRELIQQSAVAIFAGGHVGILLHALRLFGVSRDLLPDTLIAWSAGAMALTEHVVLFHDYAPHGPAQSELFDEGLGVIQGLVLMPHGRRRLRVDDLPRMSVLARRFAPDRCVVLDDGVRLDLRDGDALPPTARVIADDGRIKTLEVA